MGYWLGGTIIVLAIGLGIVGQRYYESDQTDNQQALTITDLNQQIRGMRGDIATTASLKAQLAAAQRDADSARANVKSLEDQVRGDAESLSSQLAGRDQTIDQQRAELQQQQSQIQQLAQADSQTTAQLNQLRAQNGAANYPQQSVSPIVQPMYSVPIYATHNVVEAESLEANTFAQVQAASNRVNQLTLTLRSQFEASPQYLQAKSDLNAAKSTYDATLAVVIGEVELVIDKMLDDLHGNMVPTPIRFRALPKPLWLRTLPLRIWRMPPKSVVAIFKMPRPNLRRRAGP